SNPSFPVLVNYFPDIIWRDGIIQFNKAYILNENLNIYDLENPSNPQLLNVFNTPGNANDISIQGNIAFIADEVNGVLAVDITDDPVLIGQYSFEIEESEIIDVKVLNDLAFLIDDWYYGANKFRAIDISDPDNPLQVGEMPLISTNYKYAFDVAANGYVYFLTIIDNDVLRLHTVNVQDPSNMTEVATVDFAGNDFSDLYVNGNHLYASVVTSFVIFDVSDPLNPEICGTVTPDKGVRIIDIKDDLAFVSSRLYNYWDSKFYIYDLSDPCDPNELSSVEIPTTSDRVVDLSIGNGLLTIIRSSRGYVYQVSDPNNPLFLQTIEKTDFYHQFLDVNSYNNYLYLTESTYGVRIFDIGDAQNIEEIAYYRNLGALGTDAFSNKFYVASRELGLEIVRNDLVTAVEQENSLPTEFALSQNYPNPFNPSTSIQYAVRNRQFVSLKVYDVL
ncbi:MAG: LVIVD repeat-containing protein, partial [Candidatus Heimdallarchaeota archaeon]